MDRAKATTLRTATTSEAFEVNANLGDVHQHYTQNQEAYQQSVSEDANAAGHDIKFGGQNHPAQTLEQPKESQNQ